MFKKPIGSYIRSRKLSSSIKDLLYSNLHIQDIALEYGFSIETAFRTAREADPGITLYYNDYSLEYSQKAEAVWKMINDINSRYKRETEQARNLIEGLGLQAHYQIKSFDENPCLFDRYINSKKAFNAVFNFEK